MRAAYTLTATSATQVVQLQNFQAAKIFVENPTGSVILIRSGGNDVPTTVTANHRVPAGSFQLVPASGTQFALAFDDPTSVSSPGRSNLMPVATVWFLSAEEPDPSFGSAGFQTLSLSPLTSGFVAYSGAVNSQTFDLGPWGGALVAVAPSAGSGQATVTVQNSDDGTTWRTQEFLALWPGITTTIQVARLARYLRVSLAATTIVGEPAIAGSYSVRATLAEVTQTTWTAGTGSISKAYNVPNLSTRSFQFVTVGLDAVGLRLNNTSGNLAQMVWYTSPDLTTWSLVAFREQSVAGFYNSIYRSVGQLDTYLRVDILEIGNTGPVVGTLALFIQPEPDLTAPLQQIYGALGDPGQPTNANQSIYHNLVTMRTTLATQATLATRASEATLSTLQTQFRANTGSSALASGAYAPSGAYQNMGASIAQNIQIFKLVFSWSYNINPVNFPSRWYIAIGDNASPVATLAVFNLPSQMIAYPPAAPVGFVHVPRAQGMLEVALDGTVAGGQLNSIYQNVWIRCDDVLSGATIDWFLILRTR